MASKNKQAARMAIAGMYFLALGVASSPRAFYTPWLSHLGWMVAGVAIGLWVVICLLPAPSTDKESK